MSDLTQEIRVARDRAVALLDLIRHNSGCPRYEQLGDDEAKLEYVVRVFRGAAAVANAVSEFRATFTPEVMETIERARVVHRVSLPELAPGFTGVLSGLSSSHDLAWRSSWLYFVKLFTVLSGVLNMPPGAFSYRDGQQKRELTSWNDLRAIPAMASCPAFWSWWADGFAAGELTKEYPWVAEVIIQRLDQPEGTLSPGELKTVEECTTKVREEAVVALELVSKSAADSAPPAIEAPTVPTTTEPAVRELSLDEAFRHRDAGNKTSQAWRVIDAALQEHFDILANRPVNGKKLTRRDAAELWKQDHKYESRDVDQLMDRRRNFITERNRMAKNPKQH